MNSTASQDKGRRTVLHADMVKKHGVIRSSTWHDEDLINNWPILKYYIRQVWVLFEPHLPVRSRDLDP